MLFVYYVGRCFSYVMFITAYVSTMQHTTLHSPKCAKSMLKLCLDQLKSTQLFNTYANTIQNLFIGFTQLCIYYAIESSAFPSDVHPMYLLCNKANSFYIASRSSILFPISFLAFTQCYVYSMLSDEIYLQPMFSLCDILIQLYHEIKVTQLLHKRNFSYIFTHMRNMQSMRFLCDISTYLLKYQAC